MSSYRNKISSEFYGFTRSTSTSRMDLFGGRQQRLVHRAKQGEPTKLIGYWPSVRSRWLDIGQVLFCVFMDRDELSSCNGNHIISSLDGILPKTCQPMIESLRQNQITFLPMEHGNFLAPLATSKRKTPKLTEKPSEGKWKALEDYPCHYGNMGYSQLRKMTKPCSDCVASFNL